MKIHRNQIPQEGLFLEGELEAVLIQPGEGVLRQTGPLRYRLECGANSGGFWASGTLALPVEFECVRCLRPFRAEMVLPDFATQLEWEAGDLADLTPVFREDMLLILPNYPDCHRDGGLECPGFGAAAAITEEDPSGPGEAEPGGNPWARLDALDLKNR